MMNPTILVNGQSRPFVSNQTVRDLVAVVGLDPDRPGIAVALNGQVVPRARWAETWLQPDDKVEIIHAVAGG
jgi:sulfur carrier protein